MNTVSKLFFQRETPIFCQNCPMLKIRSHIFFHLQGRINVISTLIHNVDTTLIQPWYISWAICWIDGRCRIQLPSLIFKMLVQYPNHEPSQISLHVNCYYIIQSSYDLTKERLVFCLCIFWDLYLPCLIQNSTLNGPQRTGLEIADIKKLKKVSARKRAKVSRLTARYKDLLQGKDKHQEE